MKKALIVIVILVLALAGAAFAYQSQSKTTPLIEGLEGAQIIDRKVGFIEAGGLTQQVTQWYVKGAKFEEITKHLASNQTDQTQSIFCSPTLNDQTVIVVTSPLNNMDYAYSWVTNMGKVPAPQVIMAPPPADAPSGQGGGRSGGGGRNRGGGGGQGGGAEAPDQRGKSKTGPDGP